MGGDNPFQDLFKKLGVEGAGEDPAADAAETAREEAEWVESLESVVLGFEKRNGRPVTTVRDVPEGCRAELLSLLKKAFACGGSEQDDLLLLQGDLRAQVAKWFRKQKVSVRGETG
jgi:translation initiation factor 1 (eIF-1/SUI1)